MNDSLTKKCVHYSISVWRSKSILIYEALDMRNSMLMKLPEKSMPMEEVGRILDEYTEKDIKVKGGRLFTYLYDSGLESLSQVNDIYVKFLNRNAMDYHAFPSTLRLENEIVTMIASLLHGNDEVRGNFTTGGAESILLAVKSARDLFLDSHPGETGEIVVPVTAHPAFRKAAEYLGLRTVRVPVTEEGYLADPDKVRDAITDKTAMVVVSAPNFPFGGIDPVDKIGEITSAHNVWLHVDACVGGFILPFLEKLGELKQKWDFAVPAVSSISVDLHKYGYTPKGASVILYRNSSMRKRQIYVNANWPGYPMSNVGVQSTKSSAPMAASWAVLYHLGEEGYLNLTRKILKARDTLLTGITNLGYTILGGNRTTIFAFTREDTDMFEVGTRLKDLGWFLQIQPGSVEMGMPPSLHLNTSPVHEKVAEDFIAALAEVTEELAGKGRRTYDDVVSILGTDDVSKIPGILSSESSPANDDRTLLYNLIRHMPADIIEKAFLEMVNEDFRTVEESKGR